MNLCVCGYFGMGSFEDELYLKTWKQRFPEHNVFAWSSLLDVRQIDGVLIGGGDLINPHHFHTYYFPPALRSLPTWVYSVGVVDVYPQETWPAEEIQKYRERLREARHVYVRDPKSAAILTSLNIYDQPGLVPDLIFSYNPPDIPIRFASSLPSIGVCVHSYENFPMDKMAQLLAGTTTAGYQIILIPVVNHVHNPYSDARTCIQLKEKIKSLNPAATVTNPSIDHDFDLAYALLRSVDYLVSFKLHPALVAMRHGVPAFCLTQRDKVSSMFRSLHLQDFVCDFARDVEDIRRQLAHFLKIGKQAMHERSHLFRELEAKSDLTLQTLKKKILETISKDQKDAATSLRVNDLKKKYDAVIPLGGHCQPAYHLKRHRLRRFSLPLDWIYSHRITDLCRLLRERFHSFMELSNLRVESLQGSQTCYIVNDLTCHCGSYHDFPVDPTNSDPLVTYPQFRAKMDRRIRRLYETIERANSLLFIRVNATRQEAIQLRATLRDLVSCPFDLVIVNQTDVTQLKEVDWGISGVCSVEMPFVKDYWPGDDKAWDQLLQGISLSDKAE
jgi:polysaccharide pyruvyl transferase WcaK-like protein